MFIVSYNDSQYSQSVYGCRRVNHLTIGLIV